MKTLYEALVEQGLIEPDPATVVSECTLSDDAQVVSGREFSRLVLSSEEFRLYIVEGLTNKTLPPVVLCRLMDHAWGKPPDKVEHTGKDGQPIVTRVIREIVDAAAADEEDVVSDSSTVH